MSRLKLSRNAVWRPKIIFFRKNAFKDRYVFLGGFPPGGAATHRRVFCLDFLGMFRLVGECLDFLWNV